MKKNLITNSFIITIILLMNAPMYSQDWKQDAEKRIMDIRRGTICVQVMTKDDQPVENARISIQQTRHAFRFGTAVQTHRLTEAGEENDLFREKLKKYFTMAGPENALKWGPWEAEFNGSRFNRFEPEDFQKERTMAGLKWLKENGFYVRGHNLIWPRFGRMPMYLSRFQEDSTGLLSLIKAHIAEEAYALRDYIDEWDVINEPVLSNDVLRMFGNEVMIDWFRTVREILPHTKLLLNETNLIAGAYSRDKARPVLDRYLHMLIANDAPIDALGIQGHVRWEHRLSIPGILEYLDHVQDLGLKISITEFDLRGCTDKELGDYTRDFFIAAFSHPAVTCIQVWGFWEGDIVRPDYALFRNDWTPRPNGQAYLDLVFGKWWTKAQGGTNKQGIYKTKAFYGNYEITIDLDGTKIIKKLQLPEGTNTKSLVVIVD